MTPAEQAKYDQLFPFWRYHLWGNNHGSYETIEEKISRGELRPFICPDEECDCRWPKPSEVKEERAEP